MDYVVTLATETVVVRTTDESGKDKNNGVKTELVVKLPDNQIAPTIYLDRFFEQYEEGRELSEILTDVANFVAEAYENCPTINLDEMLKGDQFVAQLDDLL